MARVKKGLLFQAVWSGISRQFSTGRNIGQHRATLEYFPVTGIAVVSVEQLSGELTTREWKKPTVRHYKGIWNEMDSDSELGVGAVGRGTTGSIQRRENGSTNKDLFLWKPSAYIGEGFDCHRVNSREEKRDEDINVSHFWKAPASVIILWCLLAEPVPSWTGCQIEILKQWQKIIALCEFRKGSSPPELETSIHKNGYTAGGRRIFCLPLARIFIGLLMWLGSVKHHHWSISSPRFPCRDARELFLSWLLVWSNRDSPMDCIRV